MTQAVPVLPMAPINWTLQFALAMRFALATGGVSLALRRGAIRVLSLSFVFATLAFGVIWGSVISGVSEAPTRGSVLMLAMSFLFAPLPTYLLWRHLVAFVAGRTTRAIPPARSWAVTMVAAATMSVVTLIITTGLKFENVAAMASAASMMAIVLFFHAAVLAFRAAPLAQANARALTMLGLGFSIIGVRSLVNLVVTALAVRSGTAPEYTVIITLAQAALLTLGSSLLLTGALDHERSMALAQAERLRVAESSLLHSQRLEALGRLSGAVAHDFNNVLAAIATASSSARLAATGTPEAIDELNEIDRAARLGGDLTRQLLAFSRPASTAVERFNVAARLRGLEGLVRRLSGRTIDVSFTIPEADFLVEMDPAQFDQVIVNLTANAREAMPAGGALHVGLRTATVPADEGDVPAVLVSVSDTGPGVPAEVMANIFEPFYSTKSTGSGLGLAICANIVRSVGGRIAVGNASVGGARFDVYVPTA